MKDDGMILIFYLLFLSHTLSSFYPDQKSDRADRINTHALYITRLIVPISILPAIQLKRTELRTITAHLIKADASFSNPLIKNCIQKMYNTQSLCPLFTIWITLNEYHLLDDQALKKEFCILILLLYKGMCMHLNIKVKSFILNYINMYYEKINTKELNELLDILNIIAQELRPLLESIVVHKKTTWREWLEKYWIPVTMTCITIVIKIILYEKKVASSENKTNMT